MSKKNKPGYKAHEATRKLRKVAREHAAKSWLGTLDDKALRKIREVIITHKPCSLGKLAKELGAPNAEAVFDLMLLWHP